MIVQYLDGDGNPTTVTTTTPLPVTGAGGGGGMTPDDISADAPATWDAETATIGVAVGTSADTAAAGNHTHTAADIGAATAAQGALADSAVQPGDLAPVATSGAYSDLSGTPSIPTVPVAAYVDPDTGTLADVINALVAAGLMAEA